MHDIVRESTTKLPHPRAACVSVGLPGILGVLLMVICCAYLVNSLTYLLFPKYQDIVSL
jgi:type III secretory pathway component EscU